MQSVSPLLRLALCLLAISAAARAASLRRPHTGFRAMRGKRSVPQLAPQLDSEMTQQLPAELTPQQQQQLLLEQLLRMASLYSQAHGGPLVSGLQDKRAPSGFAGLRGRKRQDETTEIAAMLEKRVPSGFGGLRGKKADLLAGNGDKRNPGDMFFGLRGRRGGQK